MEILKFLLSYFAKTYNINDYMPIFNLLKENSFDIKKTLSNLKPEYIKPLISLLLKQKSPPKNGEDSYNLKPIYSFADKSIINSLNSYFS